MCGREKRGVIHDGEVETGFSEVVCWLLRSGRPVLESGSTSFQNWVFPLLRSLCTTTPLNSTNKRDGERNNKIIIIIYIRMRFLAFTSSTFYSSSVTC